MDPIQIGLLSVGTVTGAVGVVKSFRRRPAGEIVERVTVEDEIALCAVCGYEADEFDDQRMRWVCMQHLSGQSRPVVEERPRPRKELPPLPPQVQTQRPGQSRRQPVQTQRPRTSVDPHEVQTVRDERMLRRQVPDRRSRQDVYDDYDDYEDDYDDYYEDEPVRSRRPAKRRPARIVESVPPRALRLDPDMLDQAIEIVDRYPDTTDKELARVFHMRYVEDARPYRLQALRELDLQSRPVRRPRGR